MENQPQQKGRTMDIAECGHFHSIESALSAIGITGSWDQLGQVDLMLEILLHLGYQYEGEDNGHGELRCRLTTREEQTEATKWVFASLNFQLGEELSGPKYKSFLDNQGLKPF